MKRLEVFLKSTRFFYLALALMLLFLHADYSFASEGDNQYFSGQLSLIARFAKLQNSTNESTSPEISTIENFLSAAKAPSNDEFSASSAMHLAAFSKLAFSNQGENSSRLLKILQVSGRIQLTKSKFKKKDNVEKPFTNHVKEAILCNIVRAKFYSKASCGGTTGLSKLYTSMEYCLIPLASIFDRWAQTYWKKGIPVLKNDFVSMSEIANPEQILKRNGSLNKHSRKIFKKVLKDFQKKVISASGKKDFLQVQIEAIQALHLLREIELKNNCNLSLSIHLVESIGFSAKNADILSKQFMKQADSFYGAFLILQASGIRLFSKIDVRAQSFHKEGIGIITNDLPAIPFP